MTSGSDSDIITVLIQIVRIEQIGGEVVIQVDFRDGRPIYEQVKDGLRRLIITGVLEAGDRLPSVRALSGSLAINPNTIQKAYEALEQEGYAYSVAGKGSFAALPTDVKDERRSELLEKLDTIVQELRFLGISDEELAVHMTKREEDER